MQPAWLARALVCAFPCLATGQVATLEIKILEGDGAVHAAGSRSARPLAVHVTDDMGQAVAGAAVSFRLPEEGPSGLFSNRLRSEVVVSDAGGRASVRHVQWNQTPGALHIRITAAKDQARAGTLSRQFMAAAPAVVRTRSTRRRMLLGLLAAGVAGGIGVAVGSAVSARSAPAPAVATGPTVTVGTPVISLGKP